MRKTVVQIVESDQWSLAEGLHNDKPLLIRYRGEFASKPDVSAYPILIRVSWSFATDDSGMPESSASDAMAIFEDRLVSAVESHRDAVLAAVITNDGQREWLFYASSTREFGRRLTEMPQEEERYPISLTSENDSGWSVLHEDILAGVAETMD
ncbi:DUF695 domain-containing protein [Pseudoxanthomonas sp. LjRoot143]|uniref:DUF695 domain-containing protein n=1 Tax=Pseudoxanthomonas sp. LjRoot143 TaxID=3342266 RepID=UPI003ECD99B0